MSRSRDLEHLKLLPIFHSVVAGLTALFAFFPLIHVAVGVALLSGVADGDPHARLVGGFFALIGSVVIAMGPASAGVVLFADRCLAIRRRGTFCLVAAGLECLLMPYGTVLGIFTLAVLMRPSIEELFEEGAAPTVRDRLPGACVLFSRPPGGDAALRSGASAPCPSGCSSSFPTATRASSSRSSG